MNKCITVILLCTVTSVLAQYGDSPAPPRPIIPGAVPAPISRPHFRTQRIQIPSRTFASSDSDASSALRIRRPGSTRSGRIQQQLEETDISVSRNTFIAADPNPSPSFSPITIQAKQAAPESNLVPRPVEEPLEDEEQFDDVNLEPETTASPTPSATPSFHQRPNSTPSSLFQRPGASPSPTVFVNRPQSLQPAILRSAKPAFRPERPISFSPRPILQDESLPVKRRPNVQEQEPLPNKRRPIIQEAEEEEPLPVRKQQVRPTTLEPQYTRQEQPRTQYVSRPQQQQQQQVVKQPEARQYYGKEQRNKKPVAQVIRKYRDDNPDGSITWGFENDDGTYKEETIGVDCMVRGKYGYVDPDGVRREYTYNSGIPCDKTTEEQQDEGYIDYQNNKYVLPNGESIDLRSTIKNKVRKSAINNYRN